MAGNSVVINDSRTGPVCVVEVAGRIDSTNAEQLMTRLNDLLSSGGNAVLVDLSRVIYLTSAAFRALLVASQEAERMDVRFELCCVAGQVRELFDMGGLLDAFTIHGSREEGLA